MKFWHSLPCVLPKFHFGTPLKVKLLLEQNEGCLTETGKGNNMLPIPLIAGGISLVAYASNKTGEYINKVRNSDTCKEKLDKIKRIFNEIDTKYQCAVQSRTDPLFGDTRGQQLQQLSVTEDLPEVSKEEKEANRHMGISSVNMGIAGICKLFYPGWLVITIPFSLYLSLRHYKKAYVSIFKEHRINISVSDSLLITGCLLANFLFAAALGIFLFAVSLKLLSKTKESSQKKLINVFSRHPRSVWILSEGVEIEIPFEKLQTGDIFVVNAGEIIPADGVITKGMGSIDQQALTGESQPAEKGIREQVLASTVLLSGRIYVQAEKAGQETVAVKIGEILNHTVDYKTLLESKTEQIVDHAVLPILILSALAYPAAGMSGSLAILASNPGYNMRVVSPLNTLNWINLLSRNNILIKDGRALERLPKVDTVIFDKTGTLTLEQPCVSRIYSCNGFSEETLLIYAAAAEYRQTHPIAKAILAAAEERKLNLPDIEDNFYEVGYGIRGILNDQMVRVGSERFMEMEDIAIPDDIRAIRETSAKEGNSLVMVAVDDKIAGSVELQPTIRIETKEIGAQFRHLGISTYIISGDHEHPTQTLARKLGIDHYFAETLPEQKAEIVKQLQKDGKKVCFVGDGINDALALREADVSVSLRGATTAAIDTAHIILMDGNMANLIHLFDVSKHFESDQRKNLMITAIPAIISIGGVFLFHFGIYAAILLFYSGLGIGTWNAARRLKDFTSFPELDSHFIETGGFHADN
ncbi:MAG: heavy metal translocating P-type ATPase [Desulfobacteraceae bacterium]|nr:heavy metal translocating P-type ATPase [Desulfobacteraceae bacterium]